MPKTPPVRERCFVEISHEFISMAILSLPLVSIIGGRMCTHIGLSLPRESADRF